MTMYLQGKSSKHLLVLHFLALLSISYCESEVDNDNRNNMLDYIKTMENQLFHYTAQNADLKLENADLWMKIEQLETTAGNYSKTIKDLEAEEPLRRRTARDCNEELNERKTDVKYYKQEHKKFIIEVDHYRNEAEMTKLNLTRCQEELKKARETGCSVDSNNEQNSRLIHLKERAENCKEALRSLTEKCRKQTSKMQKAQANFDKADKLEKECSEKLKTCQTDRSDLETMKEKYDVKVSKLEKKEKDLMDNNEKYQASIEEATIAVARSRALIIGAGVMLCIWTTIKLATFAAEKIKRRKEETPQDESKSNHTVNRRKSHRYNNQ